jgi:Protein of unknown function (DUF1553)/Protein of unknown function (DUF1549)
MHRPVVLGLLLLVGVPASAADLSDDWAFKPVRRSDVPVTSKSVQTPVDAFLLRQLGAKGLQFTPPADRATLLRRVTFDLTGLPPTVADLEAFLADESPRAFEGVVDRLLAAPAYGERQALPWLDTVRFAETDGFKADDRRPHAWRYRDYVIDSLNADKPFDRFIREQLAGDELYPDDPNALIATAFLRHYPDEYNAVNLEQRRQEILNDVTDTTAQAFLGITLGCARCHDHKFDPITQEDYYRIQAFFAGWKEVEVPIMPADARRKYEAELDAWEAKTAEVRHELEAIEKPYREKFSQKRRGRFPEEYAKLLDIPLDRRTALEQQIAAMVAKQVYADDKTMFNGMKPAEKDRWEELKKQLTDAGPRPTPPAVAMGFTDVGRDPPPTHLLKRGNWAKKGEEVRPGFLSAFDDRLADFAPPATRKTSGRRSALANWVADPKNPLTARVIVNRVWMQHFGRGIVDSPGDFGSQGEKPTHPELLDWLAVEFMNRGWSIKQMHRLIMTSEAYQMASAFEDAVDREKDPQNQYLWRFRAQRLDAETVRDSILVTSGAVNLAIGGPPVFPPLPKEILTSVSFGIWKKQDEGPDVWRRSVYVYRRRGLAFPMFQVFDLPEQNITAGARNVSTVPTQALTLLNDPFVLRQAQLFADRVKKEAGDDPARQIDLAYRIALSRPPTPTELPVALESIGKQSLLDLTHVLFNLNEFVYLR